MNMKYMNMNIISIIIIFSYHLLLMTIPTAFSDGTTGDGYILHECLPNLTRVDNTSFENTINSNYSQSRNDLLEDLRVNTSKNNGFWVTTSALDINNPVYGLAACRGDLSPEDCATCLNNVTSEASINCPDSIEANFYHDHCLMKYSDKDFFGTTQSRSVLSSTRRNSSDFIATTMGLFSNLVTKAAPNGKQTDPLFAYGQNTTAAGDVTVYAMVQCTKDIWLDCSTCLNKAIADIPQLYILISVRILYGWTCVLRYEIYPFIEEKK